MDKYEETIVWPKDFPEKEKEAFKHYLRQVAKEKEYLCVIYNPDCGCEVDQFVVLDRYPMSEKIHSICPSCKKGCLMEISDPIVFHLPLPNKDYSLEDLKEMKIMDGPQKWLIESYIRDITN